ncbi:unnamed protein product [Leptidea sinapis]|uniref:C-type lectin domain-containing protein n=1 Tax=Leptidea sinapis TaxID=189913 RepID=A0A5E4QM64_9NEOP|nr:unnamed protein product [Leptidea sinapis]
MELKLTTLSSTIKHSRLNITGSVGSLNRGMAYKMRNFVPRLAYNCAIRIRNARTGRIHSGYLPRAHGCRLSFPKPSTRNALLLELHKLNVPCSSGYIKYAPNTPTLCGKLEQLSPQQRKYLYQSSSKTLDLEIRGRPTFAVTYRLVDYCHEVLLTARNGSFEVGPAVKLFCSYKLHLPFGNRVALRLQMGSRPASEISNIIHEDTHPYCRGMQLNLQDGLSKWKHCSQPGDPLRSVQIISEANAIRLNISVVSRRNSTAMWLKVWWMDKPIEDVVGSCEYGPGAGTDDVYWIGATDAVHEGEFRWSDGLPFSYAHWFPGWRKHASQPNDDGTSGQDCVEVRREMPPRPAHPTFMWNDRSCREHNHYVCERPATNDPYRAAKIQCNETIVLSRSHPHATVSSPGFPRPYPDDADCSYDFLEIVEPSWDNRTGHEAEYWHHDPIGDNEVFEDAESLIAESDAISAGWTRGSSRRLCGDWGGKLKLLRYQSKAHVLRVRFHSDHSSHYAGYRAKPLYFTIYLKRQWGNGYTPSVAWDGER